MAARLPPNASRGRRWTRRFGFASKGGRLSAAGRLHTNSSQVFDQPAPQVGPGVVAHRNACDRSLQLARPLAVTRAHSASLGGLGRGAPNRGEAVSTLDVSLTQPCHRRFWDRNPSRRGESSDGLLDLRTPQTATETWLFAASAQLLLSALCPCLGDAAKRRAGRKCEPCHAPAHQRHCPCHESAARHHLPHYMLQKAQSTGCI